jgi:hypothetical protein
MKKIIEGGLVATMLIAVGCGSGGGTATGGSGGGAAGSGAGGSAAGATGKGGAGAAGATGGSPAGGAGGGVAGAGGAGGGVAGAGGAAGGVAGAGGAGGGVAGAGGSSGGAGGSSGGAGGSSGGAGGTTPMVPPALVPPLGATLSVQYHGVGTQIYTCTPSGGGDAGADAGAVTYSWVFKAPDAKLYDWTNTTTQVGTHGAGPEWTSSDGSVVNGVKVQSVNSSVSGAIPLLLLRASSTTGTGVFKDVTYVQRLNTTGGVAPAASGCGSSTSGMDSAVAYTADYYFFKGGGATTWLNAPSGVPTAIAAPAGTTLAIHDKGIGSQVYTCTAGTGGAGGSSGDAGVTTYSWVLLKPDAILYDATYANVGTHGMGPEWTSTDGSVVNGSKVAGSGGNATDVAWLLLKASSTTGTGVFTSVTYVQRLNTAGGSAPSTGCSSSTVNTQTSVLYSADYYFYTGTPTDGGTGG